MYADGVGPAYEAGDVLIVRGNHKRQSHFAEMDWMADVKTFHHSEPTPGVSFFIGTLTKRGASIARWLDDAEPAYAGGPDPLESKAPSEIVAEAT